jgi:hypothetical protein
MEAENVRNMFADRALHAPKISGASVAHRLELRASSLLLILLVGNCKLWESGIDLQWEDVRTNFCRQLFSEFKRY